jgi:ABC-2 type transport system permease protein
MKTIKEIYHYRAMIEGLVKKDLKGRYKGSVLGFLWTFINPLLQLAIYTFVFKIIMNNPVPQYYLHLFVALIPWIFFSSSLTTGSVSVLGQANMIKKIYFPREVIPISYTVSSFINFLLSFIIVLAVSVLSPRPFSLTAYLFIPAVMIVQFILVLGTALITSSLTVYLRDLEHIMGVLNMALMYLSPVVYGMDYIPERFRSIYMLNPMAGVIISYRDILYYGKIPDLMTLFQAFLISIIILVAGWNIFGVLKKRFAEEL